MTATWCPQCGRLSPTRDDTCPEDWDMKLDEKQELSCKGGGA